MASAAPAPGLPLLYRDLVPLSSLEHKDWRMRPMESLDIIKGVHAIPITVDEFLPAQRFFPIVFASGPDPVPLALMGLNEGVNVFVTDDGKPTGEYYLPAYVRRFPFLLAKLRPDGDELSLCFDPAGDLVGPFAEGEPLFEGDEPSERTRAALGFCEQFEVAGQRTGAFVKELGDAGLLMDGEVSIQPEGATQPFIYRGFQMVNEEKLRELRGDQLRKWNQSGLLPLLWAHLFSLGLISEIFARQQQRGLAPSAQPDPR